MHMYVVYNHCLAQTPGHGTLLISFDMLELSTADQLAEFPSLVTLFNSLLQTVLYALLHAHHIKTRVSTPVHLYRYRLPRAVQIGKVQCVNTMLLLSPLIPHTPHSTFTHTHTHAGTPTKHMQEHVCVGTSIHCMLHYQWYRNIDTNKTHSVQHYDPDLLSNDEGRLVAGGAVLFDDAPVLEALHYLCTLQLQVVHLPEQAEVRGGRDDTLVGHIAG